MEAILLVLRNLCIVCPVKPNLFRPDGRVI